MNEPNRPAIRYHGGKWNLSRWILQYFPAHRVYVEPYGGGASVLLRKPRSYAEVYNDLNGDVVNLFRVLQNEITARWLQSLLELTPFARSEFYLSYEDTSDPIERARRTIIRSYMGHGNTGVTQKARTGFRSCSNRSGTTPAHDWANYPACIALYTERLRGVVIECRDALDVMRQHDSDQTLHYVDPPYVHATRGCNKRYTIEMTDVEHRALADFLHTLRGFVVISGYDSQLYNEIYDGWGHTETIALADGALKRIERLWFSPKTASALHPSLFGQEPAS